MTTQDLPRHIDLKTTMTLLLRSGQVTTHVVKRAAVRSPLDRINHGIKHTGLVESWVRPCTYNCITFYATHTIKK
jgi:hypothetical protein